MLTPVSDSPFAVLTLIAAPAVFTNASSVLALGTGNRLARVVDRTRALVKELHSADIDPATRALWVSHLGRLEKRGALLVRAMSFFYGAIGCFAAASVVSILGASVVSTKYRWPFEAIVVISRSGAGAKLVQIASSDQLLPAAAIFIFCNSSRSAAGGQFSRSLL